MIQIFKTGLHGIACFRRAYFKSLPRFQELYLELLVEDSDYYLLINNQREVGYFIKTKSNILVEFYLVDDQVPDAYDIFLSITRDHSIHSVYCKTFDALLMDCCLLYSSKYQMIGRLFRDSFQTIDYPLTGLTNRYATMADYPYLLLQEDGLYEAPEELSRFVRGGNVLMFMNDHDLYGCGYLTRIHVESDYYDIGMWVNPRFRQKGIATGIISGLKRICSLNNWIPVCGCSYDNLGSKRTLEKNGFVSKYKLVKFELKKHSYPLSTSNITTANTF